MQRSDMRVEGKELHDVRNRDETTQYEVTQYEATQDEVTQYEATQYETTQNPAIQTQVPYYKTGMYGGSFNPLHMGHVDCIIQAANLCERFYLVLSIGHKRQEIDARVRYRWLYTLTKHIGNVTILTIEDDADTKEEYTEDIWKEDAKKVLDMIGEPLDVVFAGDDYGEDSFWNVCYPDSEFYVFPRNGISSTKIRQNPYKHWKDRKSVG